MSTQQSPSTALDGRVEHTVYGSFAEARQIKEEWDALASQQGDLHCCYDWCEVWWRHYGDARRLEIHAVRVGKELAGVVPLFRERLWLGGAGIRVVRLVGCDHAVTPPGLAVCPDAVEPVVAAVLAGLQAGGRWDALHLGQLRPYIAAIPGVVTACSEHSAVGTVIVGHHEDCVSIFDLPSTYAEYLASLRASERRNIVRCERNLCASHDVQVDTVQTSGEVQQAVDALVRLHQDLWTAKGEPGQFCEMRGLESFHRDIIERMRCAGRLILITLKIDGQIRGVEYGCRFGPRVYPLIRGYCDDDQWRTYSIGRMLHCHMIQEAIRQGVRMMDDGRGPFEYKKRLGAHLACERSMIALRQGRLVRPHFWLALQIARLWYGAYRRGLIDWLLLRRGSRRWPQSCRHVRLAWLAHTLWRTHFRLVGDGKITVGGCRRNSPLCPYAITGGTAVDARSCVRRRCRLQRREEGARS